MGETDAKTKESSFRIPYICEVLKAPKPLSRTYLPLNLANRSTGDAASALQGKAAGVQILNYSGAPGQGSAAIAINENLTQNPGY